MPVAAVAQQWCQFEYHKVQADFCIEKKNPKKPQKSKQKKKTIPNNPKFLAQAGTLTEILAIFRVFADLFFCL